MSIQSPKKTFLTGLAIVAVLVPITVLGVVRLTRRLDARPPKPSDVPVALRSPALPPRSDQPGTREARASLSLMKAGRPNKDRVYPVERNVDGNVEALVHFQAWNNNPNRDTEHRVLIQVAAPGAYTCKACEESKMLAKSPILEYEIPGASLITGEKNNSIYLANLPLNPGVYDLRLVTVQPAETGPILKRLDSQTVDGEWEIVSNQTRKIQVK